METSHWEFYTDSDELLCSMPVWAGCTAPIPGELVTVEVNDLRSNEAKEQLGNQSLSVQCEVFVRNFITEQLPPRVRSSHSIVFEVRVVEDYAPGSKPGAKE